MVTSNIPLVDFYKSCIDLARKQGYILVNCLIARDYPSRELYNNLYESWTSLHSMGKEKMLFMFADPKEYNSFEYIDFHILNGENRQFYDDRFFRAEPFLPYITAFPKEQIARSQTLQIDSLKKFFGITGSSRKLV